MVRDLDLLEGFMARVDAIVLGAGIVGVSVALQLVKRGMSVGLIDRAGVGEQTSYGNSGVIEGSTILPPAFPAGIGALLRVAFKRASDANYRFAALLNLRGSPRPRGSTARSSRARSASTKP
jgi:D-amino-acid dehydrogenase